MGLFLFHSVSLAPHLPHFLDALTQKHFDLKLKDSFRVLVPNEEMRSDVENWLLKSEESRGLLIGQSVRTLQEWLSDLLLHHGRPQAQASPTLQRKALRLALPRHFPKLKSDPLVERRALFELRRLARYHALLPSPKAQPWLNLMGEWEKTLEEKFRTWSPQRRERESLKVLREKGMATLEGVQEIYFLGFTHPDPLLLQCLDVLLESQAERDLYLFLPPLEDLARGQEAWERPIQDLVRKAGAQRYSLESPRPSVFLSSHPTPIHEARQTYRQFREFSGPKQILVPRKGDFPRILHELFAVDSGLSAAIEETSQPLLWNFLTKLREEPEEGPVAFESLFAAFFSWLEGVQADAQRTRDLHSLKFCTHVLRQIQEMRVAEWMAPELLPRSHWLDQIQSELMEGNPRLPDSHWRGDPVRELDQGGLAQVDHLWIGGLQEGDFPPPSLPFLLADDFQDPHWVLEKELAFRQNLGRATQEVQLSLAETSLSGRALSPSPLVADWEPALNLSGLELPLKEAIRHPYALENIQRERRRSVLGELTQDAGDLRDIEGGFSLLEKMQRRPLSAGYIDDYAKCPWRFFARFSLGLKRIPEEDLEMEPLSRGTFQHALLEKIFKRLDENFFSKQAIPKGEAIQ